MKKICFATQNKGKLSEIEALLGASYQVVGLQELAPDLQELEETQETLEGNALQKARYVFEEYGIPCFADDSGLEVAALGGAPGVYSARYAGPDKEDDANMALLLHNMEGVEDRGAAFRTVIAYINKQGHPHMFEGVLNGCITRERRGSNGFGYDPIFVPWGREFTLAEISLETKNKISHRTQAMEKLASYWRIMGV